MRTSTLVSILLLSIIGLNASAQTDYLVTLRSDTLKGEIRILSYDQQDRIQISVNGKKENLKATEVSFVSLKGEIYRAQRKDNSIRMMKLIKEGFLSIYAFKVENQPNYDGRMLVRKDGTSIEVPNLSFKKSLSAYLENCKTVSEKIMDGEYSRNDLEKIVDDYNNCMVLGASEVASVKTQIVEQSSLQQEKTEALNSFTKKVASMEFATRSDAMEVLQDMQTKVDRNENIPNYQIEGLKSLLNEQASIQTDLEKLIALLKEKSK
jgi:hypothetical protein